MLKHNLRRSPLVGVFQVGVAFEAGFVEVEEPAGFVVGDAAFGDGALGGRAEPVEQGVGVELHVLEHLADRVAVDHRVEGRPGW